MKILTIIETGGGGSGRHVLDLLKGLEALGFESHVIYSPQRAEAGFERGLKALRGSRVVAIEIHKSVGWHDIGAFREIRRYILDAGPFDIVHGHSSKGGALGRLAALGTGAAKVYTPHGLYTLNPVLKPVPKFLYGLIEAGFARTATDAVIAVSDTERDHAIGRGFPAKKIHLVCNGVDPRSPAELAHARERVRNRLGIAPHVPVVGFVGRFCTAKAAERFVELARAVRDAGEEARFVLLGSGQGADEIRHRIEHYGLTEMLSVFPDESGEAFMPAFDIFTLTSRYEAMPYVLLEALAAGRPIVATDVGGSRTVIDDGINGYVVPQQDDIGEMAQRVLGLLRDPALRERMTEAAREKSRQFTLDAMIDATVSVYRQVSSQRVVLAT